MSLRPRDLRPALPVAVAFAAILGCAAGAAAETKTGEGAEPLVEGHPGAQAALVNAFRDGPRGHEHRLAPRQAEEGLT